jgi:RNA polymerase sigma factor (sigma-70 family)
VEQSSSNATQDCGSDEIRLWLESAAQSRLLSKDETIEIARDIQASPAGSARRRRLVNKLVQHNMRLVAHVVKGFMRSTAHRPWGSPDTLDFLQVGCLGLVKAAEKYDPSLGYAFSTYAAHWIRSVVGRYNLKTITPVYVPESAARQMIFYRRNGYYKTNAGTIKSAEWAANAQRDIDMAYQYVELDRPLHHSAPESSDNLCIGDNLPDRERPLDPEAFHQAIVQAMHEAGISELGQKILFRNLVDGLSMTKVSAELGMRIDQARKEKSKALNQAKLNRELFREVAILEA